MYQNTNIYQVPTIVLNKVTTKLPAKRVLSKFWPINNVHLADPEFDKPGEIDILLGADIYAKILLGRVRNLGENLPTMVETSFGWIIYGGVGQTPHMHNNCKQIQTHHVTIESADEILQKFWRTEEFEDREILSQEEKDCEEDYLKHVSRDSTGRYIVALLFRKDMQLGDSYMTAKRRLQYLQGKFKQNKNYCDRYSEFMQEYLELNHMEIVPNFQEDKADNKRNYYIPHHAIIKENSSTTKLRVVFDASAKSSNGKSLNENMMIGKIPQQDLISIVMRFRAHKFVITADIKKMYRQIRVVSDHSDFQRILWFDEKSNSIECYRLTTVTYGTAAAPFLATRCLKQLADDDGDKFGEAKQVLLQDFYVDDLMSGGDDISTVTELQTRLIELLSRGGFELHKWSSNDSRLLENIDLNLRETSPISFDQNIIKTLGLYWMPGEDILRYRLNLFSKCLELTKREILATIAKIYDPLGLLGPIICVAKIFMQKLWRLGVAWDEPLNSEIINEWQNFRNQLADIENIEIQRSVRDIYENCQLQLHGFCDASQLAYGACIYLRCVNSEKISVRLLISKSRIAPIKSVSIPRLELNAALLLSRLMKKVVSVIGLNIHEISLWTDSSIVLCWLKAQPNRWTTYVANRVSAIQELTTDYKWCHISSKDNPADQLSRGTSVNELRSSQLWWFGPKWLSLPNETLEMSECADWSFDISSIPEQRNLTSHHAIVHNSQPFNKYSSLIKTQRVLAYCLRFVANCKSKVKIYEPLSVEELNRALVILLKCAQFESFSEEIYDLNSSKLISKRSKLRSLHPFIDNNELLRVGGRLSNSELTYDQIHPIILPNNHYLTTLIIRHYHLKLLHAETQNTLFNVRLKYWPLHARNEVRRVIRNCVICFRFKAKVSEQLMGELPKPRVTPSRPFTHVGVDYAGPFLIKQSKSRKTLPIKAYISIFICLVSKAIHIELVTGLDTDSFLNALKRFIARRGKCSVIYSDRGTNFQGANHELHKLYQLFKSQCGLNKIVDFTTNEGIRWKFNPPKMPNAGGLWEAGIKSIKFHTRRVIGKQMLTFEEFYTILTQIEAILNSRPLIPLSDDPNNFSYLTPSHFLVGEALTAIPEPDLTHIPEGRLSRYQLLEKLKQDVWKSWSRDYLHSLQQRNRWSVETSNLKPNMLVLIKEDGLSPLQWNLARIELVHPGDDGKVRVATVRTANGVFKRPTSKLCPLPINEF